MHQSFQFIFSMHLRLQDQLCPVGGSSEAELPVDDPMTGRTRPVPLKVSNSADKELYFLKI